MRDHTIRVRIDYDNAIHINLEVEMFPRLFHVMHPVAAPGIDKGKVIWRKV